MSGHARLLEPEGHGTLAAALGDRPEHVQSVHALRQGSCRAYVAGDPAHFEGAIIQPVAWPEEPAGHGQDPGSLWTLLQQAEGWTCVLVDTEVAADLGGIIETEMGRRVR